MKQVSMLKTGNFSDRGNYFNKSFGKERLDVPYNPIVLHQNGQNMLYPNRLLSIFLLFFSFGP